MVDPVAGTALVGRAHPAAVAVVGAAPSRHSAQVLSRLVHRIARGDRAAFVVLSEALHGEVGARVAARLGASRQSRLVVDATFVDVWLLAGSPGGPAGDVRAWVNAIADARTAEALRFLMESGVA
jgi:hypothetical protein